MCSNTMLIGKDTTIMLALICVLLATGIASAQQLDGTIRVDGTTRATPNPTVDGDNSYIGNDIFENPSNNGFVWADLSTYDIDIALQLYGNIFRWDFIDGTDGYYIAMSNLAPIGGVYLMPDELQQLQLPSFWMSYIQIYSVHDTVSNAQSLGGTVEFIEETPEGSVALIRDPAGAGFTVIEDWISLAPQPRVHRVGKAFWNELTVSDATLVIPFYTALFNWRIERQSEQQYLVYNQANTAIATIVEVDDDTKGIFEYWAIYFGVANLARAIETIEQQGGTVVYRETDQRSAGVTDSNGAFFIIQER